MLVKFDEKTTGWKLGADAFNSLLACKSEKILNINSNVRTWNDVKITPAMLDEFDADCMRNLQLDENSKMKVYLNLLSMKLFDSSLYSFYMLDEDVLESDGGYTIFGKYKASTTGAIDEPESRSRLPYRHARSHNLNVDYLLFASLMRDEGAYIRMGCYAGYSEPTVLVIIDDAILVCNVYLEKSPYVGAEPDISGYYPGKPNANGEYLETTVTVASPCSKLSNRVMSILRLSKVGQPKSKARFAMLVYRHSGWSLSFDAMVAEKPDIDFSLNYNEDLPLDKIRNFVTSAASNNQLMAFHGESGTGKTTFIRWLAAEYPDTQFVLLQGSELQYISHSSFIEILRVLEGSVIVIEDCETLLAKRSNGNSHISTLLNLTDGIMGSSLRLKFICTFNTNKSNIDAALLRKGRMYLEYDFGKLSMDRCLKLLEKIGKTSEQQKVTAPMPLCNIYNIDNDNSGNVSRNSDKIGFGSK